MLRSNTIFLCELYFSDGTELRVPKSLYATWTEFDKQQALNKCHLDHRNNWRESDLCSLNEGCSNTFKLGDSKGCNFYLHSFTNQLLATQNFCFYLGSPLGSVHHLPLSAYSSDSIPKLYHLSNKSL